MKKIILIAILAGFSCFSKVYAQNSGRGSKLGIGADFIFPVGSFADKADFGTGVSLLFQNRIAESLRFTVGLGYLRINGPAQFVGVKYKEGYVPIKAGLRYFLTENIYAGGELGAAISSANGSGSGTAFAYAPGIGAEFPILNDNSLDFNVRYEGWSRSDGTRSFIGLRAGFNF